MQEVKTGMREKGINNMECVNREEWRRKINLQGEKDVQTSILCTSNKNKNNKHTIVFPVSNNVDTE